MILVTLQRALSVHRILCSAGLLFFGVGVRSPKFLLFGDSSSRRPHHFTFLAILAPPQDLAHRGANTDSDLVKDSAKTSATPRQLNSATQLGKPSIPQYCLAALAIHLMSKMLGPIRSALGSIALLALVSSTSAASSSTNTRGAATTKKVSSFARQAEFIRAMKAVTQSDAEAQREIAKLRRLRKEESKANFHRRLMARAVTREEAEASIASGGGSAATTTTDQQNSRKLENNYYYYNNNNGNQNEEADWGSFGFDPSAYSLKYTACSAIAEINDNADENAESMTITRRFVVFRLCPTDTCGNNYSSYSHNQSDGDMDTSTSSFAANTQEAASDFDGNLGSNYLGSRGCGNSYGEYLVPLQAYVEEYATYKEEQSQVYCQYCATCMYFEQYFYSGNRDRDLGADDYYQMDDDAAAANMYVNKNNGDKHACKYYSACENYLDVCEAEDANANADDDQQEAEADGEEQYEQFLECVQWDGDNNYGNAYYYDGLYIGPQCAQDGYSIEFGVFSDEYCSTPVSGISASKITGISNFGADYLSSFYDEECITCQESALPYMTTQGDNQDDNDITELCEVLYESSAKCNVNLPDALASSYVSSNQYANEELACSFIENVVKGAYDQYGYVKLDESNSIVNIAKVFTNYSSEAPPSIGQIFAIVALGAACAIMLVTIGFMQRSLHKWEDAKRRRALVESDAIGDYGNNGMGRKASVGTENVEDDYSINRNESGVMMGRSFGNDYPDGTYVME